MSSRKLCNFLWMNFWMFDVDNIVHVLVNICTQSLFTVAGSL